MNIKNQIRNSLFAKSISLAKSNPDKICLMVLFDALFIVSFFILKKFFDSFAGQIPLPTTAGAFYTFMIFSLVYYLIVLFIYSFFKYGTLHFIKSLFSKSYFSAARLWDFYLLNVIIAGIFFGIMLAFNLLLASLKQSYAPYVFIVLAIPYFLSLYVITNISHSIFYAGNTIKNTLKKSSGIIFTNMKFYRETVFIMILSAMALWLVFLGSGYLVRYFTSGNNIAYLITYGYFRQASLIVIDIIAYVIVLINRISFYSLMNPPKSHK